MEFTQGVRFDSLGLTEEVQRALKKKNIEELTKKEQGNIVDVLLITAPFYKQCFPEYF